MTVAFEHTSVLLEETVVALQPQAGMTYVDCTLGGGGHTEAILDAADCKVIGIDRDPSALKAAGERLARFGERFVPVRARFSEIAYVLADLGIDHVDGVIADLGVSSPQLDLAERGFSFRFAGPVDMRMDPDASLSADDIVNRWREEEIARVIFEYGEERRSRAVARAIVANRPITDTLQLAKIIAGAVGRTKGRIHPATKSFQGLRIAVNDELGEIERFLPAAIDVLRPGGRLCIITFHSLEDRLVKRFMAHESGREAPRDAFGHPVGTFRLERPRKSVTAPPSDPNPRARSARLRTAVRLPHE
ncbi:MAG: 16S rRNA (cytosine(1402)-N(4))-methyltransferase RsmH [Deltaproteobacteria bacterium]|nr:MAG: 16S rRNA (cytosine(1402)-N(4))-methyltransferase RsmH [Deltaproteobacteria bacterium]